MPCKLTATVLFTCCVVLSGLFPHTAFSACPLADKEVQAGNFGMALSYYEMCATDSPNPEDLYKAAILYYKGKGVSYPDFGTARKFLIDSAKMGYAPSQTLLGIMSKKGEGLDAPDNKNAYMWFLLAAEKPANKWIYGFETPDSPKAVEYLKATAKLLSKEDTAAAISAAGKFKQDTIFANALVYLTKDEYIDFQEKYSAGGDDRRKALAGLRTMMDKGIKVAKKYRYKE